MFPAPKIVTLATTGPPTASGRARRGSAGTASCGALPCHTRSPHFFRPCPSTRFVTALGPMSDFDAAAGRPHVIGRFGDTGRAVHRGAVLQVEHAAVPRALHAQRGIVELAVLQRSAGMAAAAANGVDRLS